MRSTNINLTEQARIRSLSLKIVYLFTLPLTFTTYLWQRVCRAQTPIFCPSTKVQTVAVMSVVKAIRKIRTVIRRHTCGKKYLQKTVCLRSSTNICTYKLKWVRTRTVSASVFRSLGHPNNKQHLHAPQLGWQNRDAGSDGKSREAARIWRHKKCVGQRKNAENKLKTRKKHSKNTKTGQKSTEKCLLQEFFDAQKALCSKRFRDFGGMLKSLGKSRKNLG